MNRKGGGCVIINKKLRNLRLQAGLSQTQLADYLHVSRAAIAKWENGNGLPDIQNLKIIADYFHISVDSLLNDYQSLDYTTISMWIDLSHYGGSDRSREVYDAFVSNKYPGAHFIYPVSLISHFNLSERIVNILTFGLYKHIWQATHWKEYTGIYYLVDTCNGQFLVEFDDELMGTTRLEYETRTITGVFFERNRKFVKSGRDLVRHLGN